VNACPNLPKTGFFSARALKAVMVELVLGFSGVSSASALSAGDDSAPEVSEKRSASNGRRGVVKEGLRKAGAGVAAEPNADDSVFVDCDFEGVAKLNPAAQ